LPVVQRATMGSTPGPLFPLVESKLRPPPARPGIVPRTALVDRLLGSPTPSICVVAPPGYGKTTLLAQWAARNGRRVGWVSVDHHDNDPAVLLTYIATALDRIELIDPTVFHALASPGVAIAATVVPRLAAALSSMSQPVALVLDHVEVLSNWECLDAIAELAVQLPGGSQLALASRGELPLPVASLRAQGQVVEIGVNELAMDHKEARALLEGAGAQLGDVEAAKLIGRTEGWPAGLYLAALALRAGAPAQHCHLSVHRRRSVPDRLPSLGAADTFGAGAGVVHDSDGCARPDVRAALRRGPGRQGVGPNS